MNRGMSRGMERWKEVGERSCKGVRVREGRQYRKWRKCGEGQPGKTEYRKSRNNPGLKPCTKKCAPMCREKKKNCINTFCMIKLVFISSLQTLQLIQQGTFQTSLLATIVKGWTSLYWLCSLWVRVSFSFYISPPVCVWIYCRPDFTCLVLLCGLRLHTWLKKSFFPDGGGGIESSCLPTVTPAGMWGRYHRLWQRAKVKVIVINDD